MALQQALRLDHGGGRLSPLGAIGRRTGARPSVESTPEAHTPWTSRDMSMPSRRCLAAAQLRPFGYYVAQRPVSIETMSPLAPRPPSPLERPRSAPVVLWPALAMEDKPWARDTARATRPQRCLLALLATATRPGAPNRRHSPSQVPHYSHTCKIRLPRRQGRWYRPTVRTRARWRTQR